MVGNICGRMILMVSKVCYWIIYGVIAMLIMAAAGYAADLVGEIIPLNVHWLLDVTALSTIIGFLALVLLQINPVALFAEKYRWVVVGAFIGFGAGPTLYTSLSPTALFWALVLAVVGLAFTTISMEAADQGPFKG
jgi:hypothetical protein